MFWPCVSNCWRTVCTLYKFCPLHLELRVMVCCSKTHTSQYVSTLKDGWWAWICLWIFEQSIIPFAQCYAMVVDIASYVDLSIQFSVFSLICTTWSNMSSHSPPLYEALVPRLKSWVCARNLYQRDCSLIITVLQEKSINHFSSSEQVMFVQRKLADISFRVWYHRIEYQNLQQKQKHSAWWCFWN